MYMRHLQEKKNSQRCTVTSNATTLSATEKALTPYALLVGIAVTAFTGNHEILVFGVLSLLVTAGDSGGRATPMAMSG